MRIAMSRQWFIGFRRHQGSIDVRGCLSKDLVSLVVSLYWLMSDTYIVYSILRCVEDFNQGGEGAERFGKEAGYVMFVV